MLRLLLDECIDPAVVRAVLDDEPTCTVTSVHFWHESAYRGATDRQLLAAAANEGLTLVTRDVTTIPPLLADLYSTGRSHAGVIFVSERMFPRQDIGLLARALANLWSSSRDLDWRNLSVFLRPPK